MATMHYGHTDGVTDFGLTDMGLMEIGAVELAPVETGPEQPRLPLVEIPMYTMDESAFAYNPVPLADEECCYQNAATCPDCGSGMQRLGTCFSCPSCGWGSCS